MNTESMISASNAQKYTPIILNQQNVASLLGPADVADQLCGLTLDDTAHVAQEEMLGRVTTLVEKSTALGSVHKDLSDIVKFASRVRSARAFTPSYVKKDNVHLAKS